MSQLKVDNITDELGTGAPDFPNGLTGVVPASSITGALNATGAAPIFACRAFVNFNGTGTIAIRGSGNVSSITDNGVGNYIINFATAMPDANYSAQITKEPSAFLGGNVVYDERTSSTASALRVLNAENSGLSDSININVSVFR